MATPAKLPSRLWRRSALAWAAVLFGYAALRAYYLSFTPDESRTYLTFVQSSLFQILTFSTPIEPGHLANNHVLNTMLTKLSAFFLGDSPLALRLPNVAAHVLYLTAAYKVSFRVIRQDLLAFCTFVILSSNPYVLDFFSLSRGYGLAMSFSLVALYLLLRAPGRLIRSAGDTAAVFVTGALAVLSNLAFLHLYIALCLAFLLIVLAACRQEASPERENSSNGRDAGKAWRKFFSAGWAHSRAWLTAGGISILLAIYVTPMILKLSSLGALYYGGENGFLQDSVYYLLHDLAYPSAPGIFASPAGSTVTYALKALLILLGLWLFAALLLLAARLWRNRFTEDGFRLLAAMGVMLGCALSILVQHHVFGIRYPIGRSTLFLFPSFVLAAFWSTRYFWRAGPVQGLFLAVALFCGLQWTFSANLSTCNDWEIDAAVEPAVDDLSALRPGEPVSLACHWRFAVTLNYYRQARDLDWLAEVQRHSLDNAEAHNYFLYISSEPPPRLPLEVLRTYRSRRVVLARRSSPSSLLQDPAGLTALGTRRDNGLR
ncbi:MAG TPA: hypothetical protein VLV83_26270 [Acidobacteriota bacterium]|nr:hypothetical protein [Acidobacteriota bacterium]